MTRFAPPLMLIGALALAAPASARSVDRSVAEQELSQALTAVQAAERDDAARYAPDVLDEARVMLGTAQRAADRREWTDVALYSERAKLSGDLASARSRQFRAEAAASRIEHGTDPLPLRP